MAIEPRSHLLIDGRARPLTMLLDGRGLALLAGEDEIGRHPLRRIDRVTVRGEVLIHATALHGLAAYGIPLGILNTEARLTGLFLPCLRRPSSLAEALERLAGRDDLADRLEDWRRAEVSRHARALKLGDPAAAARAGWQAAEPLLAALAGLSGRRQRLFLGAARGLAELAAARALLDAHCPTAWLGGDLDPARDLVPIFAQLLLWRLIRRAATPRGHRDLRHALARENGAQGPVLARLAENALRAPARSLPADIRRFHRHLLDIAHLELFSGRHAHGLAHRL